MLPPGRGGRERQLSPTPNPLSTGVKRDSVSLAPFWITPCCLLGANWLLNSMGDALVLFSEILQ
jgi:hypothetical protein